MKKALTVLLFGAITAACNSLGPLQDSSEPEPTATASATRAQYPTNEPSRTPTQTPTPTEAIFVREGTAPPETGEIISPTNVSRLVELARWGQDDPYNFHLTEDGRTLFAQTDVSVSSYDAQSKEMIWQYEVEVGVGDIGFNESTNTIAVGDDLGNILLLDASTGALKDQWSTEQRDVSRLEYSESGEWLASSSGDYQVTVWQLPEVDFAYALDASYYGSYDMRIIQDRLYVDEKIYALQTGEVVYNGFKKILTISELGGLFVVKDGGFLSLRRLSDASEVQRFQLDFELYEYGYVGGIAISSDSKILAIAYFNYELNQIEAIAWGVPSGDLISRLDLPVEGELNWGIRCFGDGGGPEYIYASEFLHGNENLLIRTGLPQDVTWNISLNSARYTDKVTTARVKLPDFGHNGISMFFSPDGSWIASGENLWNLNTGELHSFFDYEIVGFSADRRSLYAYQDKAIFRFSLSSLRLANRFQLGAESRNGCSQKKVTSPDGSLFFEGGFEGGDSYTSFVWGLTRSLGDWIEQAQYGNKRFVFFSPDETHMTVVTQNIVRYDLNSGEVLVSIDLPRIDYFHGAGMSLDGSILALLMYEKVQIWDLSKSEPTSLSIPVKNSYWGFINGVAVSPDGSLVAAQTDGVITVWNTYTGEQLTEIFLVARYSSLYDLTFSPDGRLLAGVASDGAVHLWGIPTQN